MTDFSLFVFTPAGLGDPTLAIRACRAGAIGVYNAELDTNSKHILERLAVLQQRGRTNVGLKLDTVDDVLAGGLLAAAGTGLCWLIVEAAAAALWTELLDTLRSRGVRVLVEVSTAEPLAATLAAHVDGVLVKGNEAGGLVGEDASFILLQKWLQHSRLPLYLRGGLTPHVAAACAAVGVAGGVLESQLLLLDELRLPAPLRTLIGNLAGSETVAVGDGERGEYFRILVRPGHVAARQFVTEADGLQRDALRARALGRLGWGDPTQGLLPIGQEVAFAAPWRKRYGHLGAILEAIRHAVTGHVRVAAAHPPLASGAPLAQALGLTYPIVQGPMTRVSDTAEFALAVAAGGGLPMIAFAMLKGRPLEALLEQTERLLAGL
jgi:NAD(P)H-dependent flavin oxidoreductase YrpB (nitropropane dioxygenase family)